MTGRQVLPSPSVIPAQAGIQFYCLPMTRNVPIVCAMSMKARAAAQAMSEESPATKADIARLERELSVVKWMTSAIVAGVVSLLLKSFAG